ncbi:DUF1330 domain-containing protein [Pseudomonas sp. NPDC090201]|uniref:DUF1330 domain-containing protein n=1 Tax=Pseudomonas sp. NPDC090201 TaxID=3364475 RepID=UPI00381A01D6
MKGYWIIFGSDVTDTEAQQEYGRLWAPIAEKYSARLKSPNAQTFIETRDTRRVVIVEFPSYAQAKACYDDPAYQQAKVLALRASSREMIIIEADLG